MEIEVYTINFFMLFEAGLRYGVNPASFLGWIFFIFFLIRSQKNYDCGIMRPGSIFLFVLFVVQTAIHLGFFDFLLLFIPGFMAVWDIFRILWAILCLIIGIRCVMELFLKKDCAVSDIFKKVFYWKLDAARLIGEKRPRNRLLMVVGSVLWGIFLAFFSGLWPLHQSVVFLMYNQSFGLDKQFLFKILFFELIALLPLGVILFLVSGLFHKGSFWQRIFKKRMTVWIFSAVCIGVGVSTLMYYFQGFI